MNTNNFYKQSNGGKMMGYDPGCQCKQGLDNTFISLMAMLFGYVMETTLSAWVYDGLMDNRGF